jgi:nucleolar complex protein 3
MVRKIHKFVEELIDCLTGGKSLSLVAVTCVGSLLVTAPHFNFRTEILKLLVTQRNPDEAFIESREALETLFQEDEDGNACTEALSILDKSQRLSRPPHNPMLG